DRNLHRTEDGAHQSEGADLHSDIRLEEHAAMPSRLCALGDDCVDAALGEPQPLAEARRAAQDLAARRLDAREQRLRRQTEMEANDLGAQRLYRSAVSLAEWRVTCRKRKRRRLNAKLGEVGRDALEPCPILCEIRRRYSVAEEIEVERLVAARPELSPAGANLIRAKRGARQRPEPASLGNGDGEIGHRRRDDRQLDAEQIEQSRVTPYSRNHHLPVGSWRLPRRRRRSAF